MDDGGGLALGLGENIVDEGVGGGDDGEGFEVVENHGCWGCGVEDGGERGATEGWSCTPPPSGRGDALSGGTGVRWVDTACTRCKEKFQGFDRIELVWTRRVLCDAVAHWITIRLCRRTVWMCRLTCARGRHRWSGHGCRQKRGHGTGGSRTESIAWAIFRSVAARGDRQVCRRRMLALAACDCGTADSCLVKLCS